MKNKPVVLTGGSYGNNDIFKQNKVLQALEHTTDIDEIKRIAQMKSRSEVLRTLDKLAIRKDFHEALIKHGLTPNDIVREMSVVISTTDDDRVKLSALQGLLKSLGLDKYEVSDGGTSTWEEIILKITANDTRRLNSPIEDYPVIQPVVPEESRPKDNETEIQRGIYEDN